MIRDGKIILLEKAVRTVPYGFLGVLFAVYLSQLDFSALTIGIVLALTTASSTVYTLVATLIGDRLGRRRTLIFFALTDALAGAFLFSSTAWWAPVAGGIIGNMTVGAGEVGPYLSLEQAILPRTSDFKHRTLAFSIYNLSGYAASSAGSILAGIPLFLGGGPEAYRPLFAAYLVSGLLGAILYSRLSNQVEQENPGQSKTRVLSGRSRPIVVKLSTLFAVDAFGGGLVGTSIISYYFYKRYSLALGSLGLIFAVTQIITALSLLAAARLADHIGLLKTMVYSHIPSNLLLAAIPFAPSAVTAVGLLFSRQSLSQMDVPTRQSYLMSLVDKSDQTAAAGITNVSRSAASSISPSLSGYFIQNVWLGTPFLIAGVLKTAYDLAVYRSFRKAKLPDENAG